MKEKYIITFKQPFYISNGFTKNACWGAVRESETDDNVYIGSNSKEISTKIENILAFVRCDKQPIEPDELGFPQENEFFLKIYIAE